MYVQDLTVYKYISHVSTNIYVVNNSNHPVYVISPNHLPLTLNINSRAATMYLVLIESVGARLIKSHFRKSKIVTSRSKNSHSYLMNVVK